MITSIIHIETARARGVARRAGRGPSPRAAFTLVEVLIGLTLGTVVLAGVLSSFLMLGRSGMNAVHYSLSESEIRRGIEEFAQDVRMAKAIKWNSQTSVTLTVPDNYASTGNKVTYAYDNSASGPTAGCLYRMAGDAASAQPRTIYVRNVSTFAFERFNRKNEEASTDAETKRLQIKMNVRRTRSTLVATNTTLVSASYTLRNKVIN